MAQPNFLLGKGERLTENVNVKKGGGPKEAPYKFQEARDRLAPMISDTVEKIEALPPKACPDDQAVVSLTLNPEYIAKSYFPLDLIREVGLEVVGSRPRRSTPEKRSRDREAVETITTELFTKGNISAYRLWGESLPRWRSSHGGATGLLTLEEISAPAPSAKIKGTLPRQGRIVVETVLHASELEARTFMLEGFVAYLESCGVEVEFGREFFARGLWFLEMDAPAEKAEDIATFTSVRAIRKMPDLRLLRPIVRSEGIPTTQFKLPDQDPVSKDVRVAILDGGVPEDHPLTQWILPCEMPDMEPATQELFSHGVGVSSAALFGSIDSSTTPQPPYTYVDHHRVIDETPGQDPHELYEVLDRIEHILSTQEYDFISLSLGPRLPIQDDDVHAWTAILDDRLSRNSTLAVIAVGNDGEGDEILGLDRVQVPSDCVNAIAVGACDSPGDGWKRALYSSKGPGRSPGLVKPDLVEFGGVLDRPFVVVSPEKKLSLATVGGTSYAAPSVLRLATGVRAHFGSKLDHLAIRALLIHTSEDGNFDRREVGWGRVARNLDDIVLCDDDTVRVVFQGEISPAKYIRAPIPVPNAPLTGNVSIKATVCYKSQTDPHHPGNYTRAGLELTFRPHDEKYSRDAQIHPDSASFFGSSTPGATEEELRRDAWKWENCLHANVTKRATSLSNPCFDIHYNARIEGRDFSPAEKLRYAMVVTIRAKHVTDLYNQVVRDYATRIEPLRPVLEIPLRT